MTKYLEGVGGLRSESAKCDICEQRVSKRNISLGIFLNPEMDFVQANATSDTWWLPHETYMIITNLSDSNFQPHCKHSTVQLLLTYTVVHKKVINTHNRIALYHTNGFNIVML